MSRCCLSAVPILVAILTKWLMLCYKNMNSILTRKREYYSIMYTDETKLGFAQKPIELAGMNPADALRRHTAHPRSDWHLTD